MSVRPPLHLSLTTLYTLDLTRLPPEASTLPRSIGEARCLDGASMVAVTSGDSDSCLLRQIAAFEGVETRTLCARYRRESRCTAVVRGGEVLSFCWTSLNRERIGESECDLVLPPGAAYIWDCATLPPYRGKGLYPALLRQIAADLKRAGYRRLWVAAAWSNHASRRGIDKIGGEHVATLVHLCLGPWHVTRLIETATASPGVAQLTCQLTRMTVEGAGVTIDGFERPEAALSGKERRPARD